MSAQRHDEISFLTGDTDLQMNADGTCVKHPMVKMRETTEDGYVYQRETCPQCEAELDERLDQMKQKRNDLDRKLENLDISERNQHKINDESDDQGWTHPQKLSLEALSTQMNRMQQMQDWLLQQKEQEMTMLRQKVEEQQRELIQKEVEMALLKEKLAQQESRMQHELKLIKAAATKHRRKERKKKHHKGEKEREGKSPSRQEQEEKQVPPIAAVSVESQQNDTKISDRKRNGDSSKRRRSRSGENSVGESPMVSQAFGEQVEEVVYATKKAPPPPPPAAAAAAVAVVEEDDFVEEEGKDQFDINDVKKPPETTSGPDPSSFGYGGNTMNRIGDDVFTVGNTVATSTYGEDRHKVVDQTVQDPYGDSGQYTGVVLLTTGMPHGLGRMLYEDDGRTYEGDWRHGRWHGFGKATFANGDAYEGEYRFDQRHGRGLYQWHDGRQYDGDFYEDKRHGRGTFIWPDGATYEGDFVHGQREGHGRYTFSDGGQYVGDWVDGRYEGYGECEWEDGRAYKGEWKQGMAHGRGVETFADGTIRHEGLWDHDDPIEE